MKEKDNLIGQRFNRWVVLQSAPKRNRQKYWVCQCDCGTIREVQQSGLKNNHSKSCGCLKKERASEIHTNDLTGKKIGKLLILERDLEKSQNNHRYVCWKCLCDCGNIITITSDNLKRQQSCGCLKSTGQQKITEILQKNQIKYFQEYSFDNLKTLRYDFYLPDYNRLIEFDGKQHFEPIEYFGGIKGFQEQQKRDQIKNNYALSNNIELIRIPYTENNLTLDILLGKKYLLK